MTFTNLKTFVEQDASAAHNTPYFLYWDSVFDIENDLKNLSDYIIEMELQFKNMIEWSKIPEDFLKQARSVSDNETLTLIKNKAVDILNIITDTSSKKFCGSFILYEMKNMLDYFIGKVYNFPYKTLLMLIFYFIWSDCIDSHDVVYRYYKDTCKYEEKICVLINNVNTIDDLYMLKPTFIEDPKSTEYLFKIIRDNIQLMRKIFDHGPILEQVIYTIEDDIEKTGISKYANWYMKNDLVQQFTTENEKYFADKLKICVTNLLRIHGQRVNIR